MRKVLIFFTAAVLLCISAGFIAAQYLSPQNAVIAAVNTPGSGIREDIFLSAAENAEDITFLYKSTPDDEQPDTLNELCENNNVSCIIAAAGKFTEIEKLIKTAESFNLPIILMGNRPTDAELQSYDKCRYIGGNIELAGEELGNLLFAAYNAGITADKNGNYMIDTALYTNQTDAAAILTDSLMRQFEYCGCISSVTEKHGGVTESDGYSAFVQSISADGASLPEAYFCTNAAVADGVISALLESGIPHYCNASYENTVFILPGSQISAAESANTFDSFSDSTPTDENDETDNAQAVDEALTSSGDVDFYPIVCFGYTENTYNNILNGNLLGAVVFNEPKAVEIAIQMAKNLSFFSSPLLGIDDLTIESDKTVLVPYVTVTKSNLAENAWLNSAQNA